MERIDIWFGDSWTIGSELQSDFTQAEIREFSKSSVPNFRDKTQNPFLSYPYLVSKHRKTVYENYAIAGGSYEFAYFQMCNWYANNKFRQDCEYCFWVQTTASSRGFGIDHDYKRHHFLGIKQYHRGELLDFQRAKGSPEFVDFDTNMMLNAIWNFCQSHYIKLKILPLWTGVNLLPELNIVPPEKFFNHPASNMLKNIFGENVFPDGGIDTTDMANDEIIEQIRQYDYIASNDSHPNKQAHERIAEYIINRLE